MLVIRSAQWLGQGAKPAVTAHAVMAIRDEAPVETVERGSRDRSSLSRLFVRGV